MIRQSVPPLPPDMQMVDPKTGMPTIAMQTWWQSLSQNGDTAFDEIDDAAAVTGPLGALSPGIVVKTAVGVGSWAARTLVAPAAGFTITNPAGIASDITFALANGLASLEGASSTGSIYYYSAADTWSPVTIHASLTFTGGTLSVTTPSLGGTVTSVSVVTANGVSGSVATATTTPAITLTLGAITPTSVAASGTVTGSNLSGTSSGTNTGDQVEASNAEVWLGSATTKFIGPNRHFAKETPQTATSSATITLDGVNGLNFEILLDTNTSLANPSNFQIGRHGIIRVTQDAVGSRAMLFGSYWRFPGGAPSLSTAANSIDVITFFVWSATMILAVMDNDFNISSGDGSLLLGGDMQSGTDKLKLGGDMTDGDDVLRIQS